MDMRSSNPFSPDFGRPPTFYGRERYSRPIRETMHPGLRPHRCIVLEGVRGTGKTALLSHVQDLADEAGWESLYATSVGAANELFHDLATTGDQSRHIAGVGGSFAGFGASVSLEKADRGWVPTLRQALLDHVRASGLGLIILVDEAQKMEQSDAQAICDALNSARAASLDVALVMAGLPGTLRRLRGMEKCTYMARSTHMVLGMLRVSEARLAVGDSLDKVPEMHVPQSLRERMVAWTCGHPYLIQLVGYDLYRQVEEALMPKARRRRAQVEVTPAMLDAAEERAYAAYAENVLSFVFERMGEGTLAYLRAIASTMGDDGLMDSGARIAEMLGVSPEVAGVYRHRMLEAGLLRSPRRGRLGFTIPYIPRFLAEGLPPDPGDAGDTGDIFVMP